MDAVSSKSEHRMLWTRRISPQFADTLPAYSK